MSVTARVQLTHIKPKSAIGDIAIWPTGFMSARGKDENLEVNPE